MGVGPVPCIDLPSDVQCLPEIASYDFYIASKHPHYVPYGMRLLFAPFGPMSWLARKNESIINHLFFINFDLITVLLCLLAAIGTLLMSQSLQHSHSSGKNSTYSYIWLSVIYPWVCFFPQRMSWKSRRAFQTLAIGASMILVL